MPRYPACELNLDFAEHLGVVAYSISTNALFLRVCSGCVPLESGHSVPVVLLFPAHMNTHTSPFFPLLAAVEPVVPTTTPTIAPSEDPDAGESACGSGHCPWILDFFARLVLLESGTSVVHVTKHKISQYEVCRASAYRHVFLDGQNQKVKFPHDRAVRRAFAYDVVR